jgi:hypothetical protein
MTVNKKAFSLEEAEKIYLKVSILQMKIGLNVSSAPLNLIKPPHRGSDIGQFWKSVQDVILDFDSCILSPYTFLGERPWGERQKDIIVENIEDEIDRLNDLEGEYNTKISECESEIRENENSIDDYDEEDGALIEICVERIAKLNTIILRCESDIGEIASERTALSLELPDARQDAIDYKAIDIKLANEISGAIKPADDLLEYLKAPLPYIANPTKFSHGIFRAINDFGTCFENRNLSRGDFLGDWILDDIEECIDGWEYYLGVAPSQLYITLHREEFAEHTFYGLTDVDTVTDTISPTEEDDTFLERTSTFSTDYTERVFLLTKLISDYQERLKEIKEDKDDDEPEKEYDDYGEQTEESVNDFLVWSTTYKALFAGAESSYLAGLKPCYTANAVKNSSWRYHSSFYMTSYEDSEYDTNKYGWAMADGWYFYWVGDSGFFIYEPGVWCNTHSVSNYYERIEYSSIASVYTVHMALWEGWDIADQMELPTLSATSSCTCGLLGTPTVVVDDNPDPRLKTYWIPDPDVVFYLPIELSGSSSQRGGVYGTVFLELN